MITFDIDTPSLSAGISPSRCFQSYFDRTAFSFAHQLHEAPQFRFTELMKLAERISRKPGSYYIEEGQPHPGLGWGSVSPVDPLLASLESLQERKALVMLKRVQTEPGYREIVEELTEELSRMSNTDMRSTYRDPVMTIVITSPERVTPYHIDGEANLLMQVLGSKEIYIFDGNDRKILPAVELERFWAGDIRAASYRPETQRKAWRFVLEPGTGVSNPVTFPHWVKNGPNVSISVSVNFKRQQDDAADAHRMNARIRKFGLHPVEPGIRTSLDHSKSVVYRTMRNVAHAFEELRHPSSVIREPAPPKAA